MKKLDELMEEKAERLRDRSEHNGTIEKYLPALLERLSLPTGSASLDFVSKKRISFRAKSPAVSQEFYLKRDEVSRFLREQVESSLPEEIVVRIAP